MRANSVLLIILGLMLCASVAASTPDSAAVDSLKTRISVLEERLKAVESDSAASEPLRVKVAVLEERVKGVRSEMDIHLMYAVGFVTLVGALLAVGGILLNYFGKKSIEKWVRERVDQTVGTEMEVRLKELTTKVDEQMEDIRKLNDDELRRLRERVKDLPKPVPDEVRIRYSELEEDYRAEKTEDEYTAEDWFSKGVGELLGSNYAAAIESFSQSIERDPEFHSSYISRALAYGELGNEEQEKADYDAAIKLNTQDAQAYLNRGVIHGKLGQIEEALADFSRTIELEPSNALAYSNLGNIHWLQGQEEDALADYSKAIELKPRFTLAHLNLAGLLITTGKPKRALAAAIKALNSSVETEDIMWSLCSKWVCELLIGDDAADETAGMLEEILQKDFELIHDFEEIDKWLETTDDITAEQRTQIRKMTDKMKAKKKAIKKKDGGDAKNS